MVKKYVKKPVVIEAIEWTGNNLKEIVEILLPSGYYSFHPSKVFNDKSIIFLNNKIPSPSPSLSRLYIEENAYVIINNKRVWILPEDLFKKQYARISI